MEKRFRTPKSKTIDLSYAIFKEMFNLFEENHLEALPFVKKPSASEVFANIVNSASSDFQKSNRVNYDAGVKPKDDVANKDLITHVAEILVTIMPALTAKLWDRNSGIKKDAEIDVEIEEFLWRNEIDKANKALGAAMDINDRDRDKLGHIINKRMNDRLKRSTAKERSKQRKKLFGWCQKLGAITRKEWLKWKTGRGKEDKEVMGKIKKDILQSLQDQEPEPL